MSDYARLMEENMTLKAQIAEKGEAKAGADTALQAKVDRYAAALQDIADAPPSETKGDMKDIATKALAGK